jgi:hypothetical protein
LQFTHGANSKVEVIPLAIEPFGIPKHRAPSPKLPEV